MLTLPIVGARFRPPAEEIILNLAAGTPLILHRQPENPYDVNAIAVLIDQQFTLFPESADENGMIHLGFIPKEHAAEIAPIMDLNSDPETFIVRDIKGKFAVLPNGRPGVMFEEPK